VYGTSEVPRVGATVTVSGEYVHLNQVTLDWPPAAVPPLLVGARGPKTVALAGDSPTAWSSMRASRPVAFFAWQRMARNKVLMVGGTDEHQASETFRRACASGDDAAGHAPIGTTTRRNSGPPQHSQQDQYPAAVPGEGNPDCNTSRCSTARRGCPIQRTVQNQSQRVTFSAISGRMDPTTGRRRPRTRWGA
jgi:hypothetical protein